MPKFQGPTYITDIRLPSGVIPVTDGIAEIPEPIAGDIMSLFANGFSLIADVAYPATTATKNKPAPAASVPADPE
jgi:hypothetical protein